MNTIPRSLKCCFAAAALLLAVTAPFACRNKVAGTDDLSRRETHQRTDQGGASGDGSVNVNIPLAFTLGPMELGGIAAAGVLGSGVLLWSGKRRADEEAALKRVARAIEDERIAGSTGAQRVVQRLQKHSDAAERAIHRAVRKVTP